MSILRTGTSLNGFYGGNNGVCMVCPLMACINASISSIWFICLPSSLVGCVLCVLSLLVNSALSMGFRRYRFLVVLLFGSDKLLDLTSST